MSPVKEQAGTELNILKNIFKTISESGVPVADTGGLQWFQLKPSLEIARPKFIDESLYGCKMKNFIL